MTTGSDVSNNMRALSILKERLRGRSPVIRAPAFITWEIKGRLSSEEIVLMIAESEGTAWEDETQLDESSVSKQFVTRMNTRLDDHQSLAGRLRDENKGTILAVARE